jgi:hypothetical protein
LNDNDEEDGKKKAIEDNDFIRLDSTVDRLKKIIEDERKQLLLLTNKTDVNETELWTSPRKRAKDDLLEEKSMVETLPKESANESSGKQIINNKTKETKAQTQAKKGIKNNNKKANDNVNGKNISNKNKDTKKNGKSTNNDEDSEDDVWEWDIPSIKNFHRHERKANTMKMIIFAEKILNARKAKGWRMELLVEYNTGERLWTMIHGALTEMPKLTSKFMSDCSLNHKLCGYFRDPTLYKGKKKLSQYDDFPNSNDTAKYIKLRNIIIRNLCNNTYDLSKTTEKIVRKKKSDMVNAIIDETNNNTTMEIDGENNQDKPHDITFDGDKKESGNNNNIQIVNDDEVQQEFNNGVDNDNKNLNEEIINNNTILDDKTMDVETKASGDDNNMQIINEDKVQQQECNNGDNDNNSDNMVTYIQNNATICDYKETDAGNNINATSYDATQKTDEANVYGDISNVLEGSYEVDKDNSIGQSIDNNYDSKQLELMSNNDEMEHS